MYNPLINAMVGSVDIPRDPMKLLESNPATSQYANMIKSGMNPKTLFYELCRQKGINPDLTLNKLRKEVR